MDVNVCKKEGTGWQDRMRAPCVVLSSDQTDATLAGLKTACICRDVYNMGWMDRERTRKRVKDVNEKGRGQRTCRL